MTWFRVDDKLHDHPKVRKLRADKLPALGLWSLAGSWAADNLTDGFVPTEIVQRYDSKQRFARRLVDVGLWLPAEHDGEEGYRFHEWGDWQPTRADVQKQREDSKERVRRWRERNGQVKPRAESAGNSVAPAEGNAPGNALQERSVTDGVMAPPTRPIPNQTKPSSGHVDSQSSVDQRARGEHADGSQPNPGLTPSARRPRGGREVAEALNATAHSAEARTILRKWAETSESEPLPPTTYTQLARQIDALRERGATGAYVWAALLTWDEKRRNGDNPKPGLLPYLHDEAKLEGLTAAQIYATPVEYLRDEDIDLYEVLGFDDVRIEAPPEIENGPMDARRAWYDNARAERRTVRCVQAREVITRRQEMRRNTKGAA